MKKVFVSIWASALLFVGSVQVMGVTRYTVTDLGTLGGESYATGISESGLVTGYFNLAGNSGSHAFLYDGTTMKDLGTLGGSRSYAGGVNNSGKVVGWSDISTEDSESHAFLYDGAAMQDLGVVGSHSTANGINDSGQIVGGIGNGMSSQAFLLEGTTMKDLGTLGGTWTEAQAINVNGLIAGSSLLSGNTARHAFVYTNVIQDLDINLGVYGFVSAVNRNGLLVGSTSANGGQQRAFLYDTFANGGYGNYTELDSGVAFGVNDNEQVVGVKSFGSLSHAFIYDNGLITDLNALLAPAYSDWTLKTAYAINNSGQIAGYGVNPEGYTRAFLLTPIPEPASLLLLGLGALALRRRTK